jgi:23S rRNA (uracil1939-C5)-methyltransferase
MGVGRGEDGRLLLLSAPLALFPGEKVEASVRWKPRHGEGQVTAWLSRDPRRVRAACAVAGVCGGCDLWEAGPLAGTLKREMVTDLLARQLPEAPAWRWLEAPETARRHRIQLHWNGRELGFHRRNSHSVVPVSGCPAAAEALSRAIARLREALEAHVLSPKSQRWELATGSPAGEVFAVAESDRSWRLEPDGWHATADPVSHALGAGVLRHRAGGFFQVCPDWAWSAFGEILGAWSLSGDTLYDLYGGVGFFSALLGDRFRRRVLVENDEPAVDWARINLAAQGLETLCVAADAAAWLVPELGGTQDLILLDPPRTGLAPELCASLLTATAGAMVLVGCDGAAFCRDLQRLAPAWELKELAVADLFPLTQHVEAVALLRKKPA